LFSFSLVPRSLNLSPFICLEVIRKLELNTLRSLKSHGGVDRALLSFDIDVDLEPAFHWNVKQLFVYVVAQYDTPASSTTATSSSSSSSQQAAPLPARTNQVVLWDKIVESTDPTKRIQEDNVFVKYALIDAGNQLRGRSVQLQLQWDHMPITGMLHVDQQPLASASSFVLPSEYS
jgi:signal peptidase complex subunit 3